MTNLEWPLPEPSSPFAVALPVPGILLVRMLETAADMLEAVGLAMACPEATGPAAAALRPVEVAPVPEVTVLVLVVAVLPLAAMAQTVWDSLTLATALPPAPALLMPAEALAVPVVAVLVTTAWDSQTLVGELPNVHYRVARLSVLRCLAQQSSVVEVLCCQ